jgi:hypothetical protein
MKLDIVSYNQMLSDNHILIIYSGPLWAEGLDGMAETLQSRLNLDDMPLNVSQAVFSVFIEQMTNMMMYSAEKQLFDRYEAEKLEVSRGLLVLGTYDKTYFIQSGNMMKDASIPLLKERLDHLKSLDKKELRKYYKEKIKNLDDNPESKGAGVGLIEIARRSTSIEYDIISHGGGLSYFTMYVTI